MRERFVALIVAALSITTGAAAVAQTPPPLPTPTPIVLPTLPPSQQVNPYVKMGIDLLTGVIRQQLINSQNTANGQVSYFRRFEMQVQTGPNAYRAVHLHQGTVINPRGESIQSGQRVSVGGIAQPDGSLNADVITIQQ